ncbi:hypothetical protein CS022_20570 [Veronia nyctiphanis]|uniref:Endonuclease/exonuclease/phosphatase domain-containing protein n=1 Tax=Veronia nyctiphanis TaxID=1278244 RepID=A0A4Q0YLF4_9GAMM|nr:endonuclease/exonuclease/phosphatase family protein [Veronia nyctiphanis]RXJ71600.1 hypothetical protein CS022_20570 [Veronia nyctiphanis]
MIVLPRRPNTSDRNQTTYSVVYFVLVVCLYFFSAKATAAIKVTTWNLEWLSDKGDLEQTKRVDTDYSALAQIFSDIEPDVMAFQEVDSEDALRRIVPSDQYAIYFSERRDDQPSITSQQYTGWVVKMGLTVLDHPDDVALSLPSFFRKSGLRYGDYIEIRPMNSKPIHLLSIHLKSGCFHKHSKRTRDCRKLYEQADELNAWISDREKKQQQYMIAGDFNHYLNIEGNRVSQILSDGHASQPALLTKNVSSQCKVKRYNHRLQRWEKMVYTNLVDHILSSQLLISSKTVKAEQYQYPYHLSANHRLSDHCPVSVTLQ